MSHALSFFFFLLTHSHFFLFLFRLSHMAPLTSTPRQPKNMILQDNPNSPRIEPKYNAALSTHGYRFVYGMIYWIQSPPPSSFSPTDKFIEFLTDGLTGPCPTVSWHSSLKCETGNCLPAWLKFVNTWGCNLINLRRSDNTAIFPSRDRLRY